jgi:hypothetical protein
MKILYPKAVHHLDRFYVLNGAGDVVQGEYDKGRADEAARVMNDHNVANGYEAVYSVVPKP